jgi:hypothetical protein
VQATDAWALLHVEVLEHDRLTVGGDGGVRPAQVGDPAELLLVRRDLVQGGPVPAEHAPVAPVVGRLVAVIDVRGEHHGGCVGVDGQGFAVLGVHLGREQRLVLERGQVDRAHLGVRAVALHAVVAVVDDGLAVVADHGVDAVALAAGQLVERTGADVVAEHLVAGVHVLAGHVVPLG